VSIRAGVLYGTGTAGGNGNGTVYQAMKSGNNWFTLPISYLPNGGSGGHESSVVFGPDGHPYGTTVSGGQSGAGLVYDLIVPITICKTVSCFWKENDVYLFGPPPDGNYPGNGDLVWDQDGNIYGTTLQGGANGRGTVFELTYSGNSWTERVIYSFSGAPDGFLPDSGLFIDKNGNLFGTTISGGADNLGTVYELTYDSKLGWTEKFRYSFQNGTDGSVPFGGLVSDSAGNLYGASSDGGINGGGTIFELSPSGNSWTFTTIYSLSGAPGQDCGPAADLTFDDKGNLYGATYCDGAYSAGNVFRLTPGNSWTYTSLYDFTGGADGKFPISNVSIDGSGNLYGTTSAGGSGFGVIWMIAP
jgi:uncharacterized repeat protein (TIGR03803 family)